MYFGFHCMSLDLFEMWHNLERLRMRETESWHANVVDPYFCFLNAAKKSVIVSQIVYSFASQSCCTTATPGGYCDRASADLTPREGITLLSLRLERAVAACSISSVYVWINTAENKATSAKAKGLYLAIVALWRRTKAKIKNLGLLREHPEFTTLTHTGTVQSCIS